jgi:cephalosporin hydroxylase
MSAVDFAYNAFCKVFNRLHGARTPIVRAQEASVELRQVEARALAHATDISDHLVTIFAETVVVHPQLIVELGVRGGESTFVFERAAAVSGAYLLSVDIEDCAVQCSYSKWSFVRRDDVKFADEFADWCAAHGLRPSVDVLFVDTSHLYEHTREELRTWLPHLSAKGKAIFHDTNMRKIYRRADGTLGAGWNNQRGVVRAIEEMLGARFNEKQDFVAVVGRWTVRHWAHCNGLTVLEKY